MAMAAAVAALAARPEERSLITGFGAVETSYPTFAEDLARLAIRRPGPRPLLVAIDGPAGAGKSTVSTAVAERLGVDRLDTGAMYRAVAALALERGTAPGDTDAVAALAAASTIEVGERVTIDGLDVTGAHPLARCRPGGLRRERPITGTDGTSWSARGSGPVPTVEAS